MRRWMIYVWVLLLIQGCAGNRPPPARVDFVSQGPITVVRCQDSDFLKYSHKRKFAILLSPMFADWGLSRMEGGSVKATCSLPDFGTLVLGKFAARAPKELPGWETMTVRSEPVGDRFAAEQGLTAVIKVNSQSFGPYRFTDTGYGTDAGMEIRQPGGAVVFERWYGFDPSAHAMDRSIDILEAENCKQLKEDMDFAADRTVEDLIHGIKLY